ILIRHRQMFGRFWDWINGIVSRALADRTIETVLGFPRHLTATAKVHGLQDWPMQSNGAELTRLAAGWASRRGIELLATHHDSLTLEADEDRIDEAGATTMALMVQAGEDLFGFPFGVAVDQIVRFPDRYLPEDGRAMWNRVTGLIETVTVAA